MNYKMLLVSQVRGKSQEVPRKLPLPATNNTLQIILNIHTCNFKYAFHSMIIFYMTLFPFLVIEHQVRGYISTFRGLDYHIQRQYSK